jgi:chitinase
MVTKAGVPANKVMVGVSSYGRSFKMAYANCRGPDCTFLGTRNNSPAKAGACTGTSGYIADAEIRQIKKIMDMGW